MDTLLVIIFVFIVKFLTYFLPEVLTVLGIFLIIGFFLSFKNQSKKNYSDRQIRSIGKDMYMQFGKYMKEDDKRGGAW